MEIPLMEHRVILFRICSTARILETIVIQQELVQNKVRNY